VFLFVGDLIVGVYSNVITVLFGVGYVVLMGWVFMVGVRVLRMGELGETKGGGEVRECVKNDGAPNESAI
jgi:hypothetical protein